MTIVRRFLSRLLVGAAVGALTAGTAHAVDPWTQLNAGLSARPGWLDAHVDRRLWLLPSLPQVELSAKTSAQNTFQLTGGPSLAVGLVLDDGLYYSRGFGYRDAQHDPADETTVYQTGSVTKVFTGTGLLTMIDNPNGRLNPSQPMTLDDDVVQKGYYPQLQDVCPFVAGTPCTRGNTNLGITLRHLVSHSSGLPNAIFTASDSNGNTDEATFTNTYIPNTWLVFPPGQLSAYSGTGTAVVGLILEHQSLEQSYSGYMINHLLLPLGMTHSVFDASLVPANKLALKYDHNGTTFTAHPAYDDIPFPTATVLAPTGALFTSIWDWSRFVQMYLSGNVPNDSNGYPILKASSLAMATQPIINEPGPPQPIGSTCQGFVATSNGVESGYAGCGPDNSWGVNWALGAPSSSAPYATTGPFATYLGANTDFEARMILDLDPQHPIAGLGLISTDVGVLYNAVDSFYAIALQQDQTATTLGSDGTPASWQNQPLAIGVARLLWLLGAPVPAGAGVPKPIPPGGLPTVNSPGKIPPGWVAISATEMESEILVGYQSHLLAQLSSSLISSDSLALLSVQSWVDGLRNGASGCSTFRVRGVPSASQVSIRVQCAGNVALDATLTVAASSPYQLQSVSVAPASDVY